MEIGQIKNLIQPLVALTREQRLSRLCQQGSERLRSCGTGSELVKSRVRDNAFSASRSA
jgi:hypothetical protein